MASSSPTFRPGRSRESPRSDLARHRCSALLALLTHRAPHTRPSPLSPRPGLTHQSRVSGRSLLTLGSSTARPASLSLGSSLPLTPLHSPDPVTARQAGVSLLSLPAHIARQSRLSATPREPGQSVATGRTLLRVVHLEVENCSEELLRQQSYAIKNQRGAKYP